MATEKPTGLPTEAQQNPNPDMIMQEPTPTDAAANLTGTTGDGKGPKSAENGEAMQPGEEEDDSNYLHGLQLAIFTVTLMLAQFLTALDGTILSKSRCRHLCQTFGLSS
jgi:hypothetical protein